MPLHFVRNDITKMEVDAIVNSANTSLLGGSGVDGAIHKAAGPELLEECRGLNGCGIGSAKITRGYRLPCNYVIHTVGPVWRGGRRGERDMLVSAYSAALALADEYDCETVAFPLISAGAYCYPKEEALEVAVDTISGFLIDHEMTVYLVVFDKSVFQLSKGLADDIEEYIDDRYVDEHEARRGPRDRRRRGNLREEFLDEEERYALSSEMEELEYISSPAHAEALALPKKQEDSLDKKLKNLDESFSEMLFRKIQEKGMTPSQCYKKANINRQHFSKIKNDVNYQPNKQTALAFAIALELPLGELKDMLMKAGFALSPSNKGDIIVEYFLEKGNYNIFDINEALFMYDQSLLGSLT